MLLPVITTSSLSVDSVVSSLPRHLILHIDCNDGSYDCCCPSVVSKSIMFKVIRHLGTQGSKTYERSLHYLWKGSSRVSSSCARQNSVVPVSMIVSLSNDTIYSLSHVHSELPATITMYCSEVNGNIFGKAQE